MLKKIEIPLADNTITRESLKSELENAFPQYRFKLFGLGPGKRIIAEKTATEGASISIKDDKIVVNGAQPSLAASSLLAGLGVFNLLLLKKCNQMVEEIGGYLSTKFGTGNPAA